MQEINFDKPKNELTMKKQIGQIIIFSAIILITSCGKSELEISEEKEKVLEQKTEHLKTINEKAIYELNHKYNVISVWDSFETFTYVLQEKFIDENHAMSFEGELKDISKADSTYTLEVLKNDWHYNWKYLALISISKEKFIEFKKALETPNHSNTGCFIIKVSKIYSAIPKIKSSLEFEDDDSYLNFDFNETLLIVKGNLIDFHLNEIASYGTK
jgi:hypothetical protein